MTEQKKALREIDAPFYNYWQALYHSFYSSRLYVDVAKRWKGLGILYFLLLMCIVTFPFALRVTLDFNRFFQEDVIQPLLQLPELYIQNGNLSLDKPMPYFVKNKYGQVVSIVDTTGTINTMDGTYPYLTTLLTKNKFFYRLPTPQFFFNKEASRGNNPIYVYPFSEHTNTVFEPQEWVKSSGIMRMKYFSGALIYPIIAAVFFVMFLIFFLAFALMAQFIAKLFLKMTLSYKQAARLLLVSATPFMVVLWLILTFGLSFIGLGLLLPALLAIYFGYAVLSLRRESNKLVIS